MMGNPAKCHASRAGCAGCPGTQGQHYGSARDTVWAPRNRLHREALEIHEEEVLARPFRTEAPKMLRESSGGRACVT